MQRKAPATLSRKIIAAKNLSKKIDINE